MTDTGMSDLAIDPAAFRELDRLLSDPALMAAKVSELAAAARSEFGQRQASLDRALEKVIEARAAAAAEYETHTRELRQREYAVTEREAAAAEKDQRLVARERALENRLADFSARINSRAQLGAA